MLSSFFLKWVLLRNSIYCLRFRLGFLWVSSRAVILARHHLRFDLKGVIWKSCWLMFWRDEMLFHVDMWWFPYYIQSILHILHIHITYSILHILSYMRSSKVMRSIWFKEDINIEEIGLKYSKIWETQKNYGRDIEKKQKRDGEFAIIETKNRNLESSSSLAGLLVHANRRITSSADQKYDDWCNESETEPHDIHSSARSQQVIS